MSETKIEWADATWNPLVGCSKVSPGCDHCYAERMACRQVHMGTPHYANIVENGHWNGKIGIADDKVWTKPLHWRKPRNIFACSMGDLFHESVTFETQLRVFAIIINTPWHTYQILTKRADRMAAFFARWIMLWKNAGYANPAFVALGTMRRHFTAKQIQAVNEAYRVSPGPEGVVIPWPLRNVWLGVTAENQETADERIPVLLDTPAVVRFVSCEPLLGAIDFDGLAIWSEQCNCSEEYEAHPQEFCKQCGMVQNHSMLDWVIAGGESGPGARPMHPDWVRDIRDQCGAAGVPFLFKQWGEWGSSFNHGSGGPEVKGKRETQIPDCCYVFYRVGKKAAGRLLDGVLHDAFPGAAKP